MKDDALIMLEEALKNVEESNNDKDELINDDLESSESIANENIVNEKVKQEIIVQLNNLKENGANITFSDDMSLDELEKILDEYK